MVGSLGGYGERWAGWLYWSIGVSSSPRKLEDVRVRPLWGDKVKGCGGQIEPLGFTINVRGSGTSLPTPSHALGEHEQAVFVEDKAQQDGEDPREEQGLPARVLVAGDGRSREELARIQRE